MSAAADLARYPWVPDFRLVDIVGSIPPIPETTDRTGRVDTRHYYRRLGRANFTAVKGGRCVTVELGQVGSRASAVPFKVETYLTIKLKKELYVSEVDEDKPN